MKHDVLELMINHNLPEELTTERWKETNNWPIRVLV